MAKAKPLTGGKPKTKPKPKDAPDLSHIVEGLWPLARPIAELHPDPVNARLHGEDNIVAIMNSLRRFKQDQPVVVQKQGMIVRKGNGRLLSALRLGWTHIAAVVVDEGDWQAVARALADNKTAELANWDFNVLGTLLGNLEQAGEKTDDLGWTPEAIVQLVTQMDAEPDADATAGGEHGDDAGGGAGGGGEDQSAGFQTFAVPLTTAQEMLVRAAIKKAKAKFQVETTGDALAAIIKEWNGH